MISCQRCSSNAEGPHQSDYVAARLCRQCLKFYLSEAAQLGTRLRRIALGEPTWSDFFPRDLKQDAEL